MAEAKPPYPHVLNRTTRSITMSMTGLPVQARKSSADSRAMGTEDVGRRVTNDGIRQ